MQSDLALIHATGSSAKGQFAHNIGCNLLLGESAAPISHLVRYSVPIAVWGEFFPDSNTKVHVIQGKSSQFIEKHNYLRTAVWLPLVFALPINPSLKCIIGCPVWYVK